MFNWSFPKYDANFGVVAKQCKARDGNRCSKCGCGGSSENPLQACHIVSKRKGGSDTLGNLKTLCRNCHSKEPGHSHMRTKKRGSRVALPF